MSDLPNNETRQRILDVADDLFSKRGYAAVTLRDIAGEVGMRHASLYYYAPGGKEQLFVEVMERSLHRHRQGMTDALSEAGDDLRDQLRALVRWTVSQPPLDISRMQHADMLAVKPEQAHKLMDLAFDAIRLPIVAVLEPARRAGVIDLPDLDLAALALVSLLQSVHQIPPPFTQTDREEVGFRLVDMLLNGWLKR